MLGRHRTAAQAQGTIDKGLDRVSRFLAAIADTDDDVKVAVAQMAEDDERRLRPARRKLATHLGNIRLHVGEFEADIETEDRKVAPERSYIVAQRPHLIALSL